MTDSPEAMLKRQGLGPKKHFGQNFLRDKGLAQFIAEQATDPPQGTVIEYGAGLGALTLPLLARAHRVIAVERDRDLIPLLKRRFCDAIDSGHLDLMEADAKAVDVKALFSGTKRPRVLCGNLPYQLTGPLMRRAVEFRPAVDRVVFLVQREVADRLASKPNQSSYGALSVFIQAQYVVRKLKNVAPGAFSPRPRVSSAVVGLEPRQDAAAENETFRRLVRAAFAQRRKKLKNALAPLAEAPKLGEAALRAQVDLGLRAEDLSVATFLRFSKELES